MTDAQRYFSQIIIPEIGLDGQNKIASAKILVVGAGGLGCPVLSYLAAMGVGFIGLVDDDKVEMKNLHRQILYNEGETGLLKVDVAKDKIMAQNNTCNVKTYPVRFTENNAEEITSVYDVVVDCCDNVETRYLIDTITKKLDKPFVYGAVRQFEGQLSVFNYRGGPSYHTLFPDKKAAAAELDCATAGIVGHVTGIIGSLQVNEVLKIILGDKHVLSGEVLTLDMRTLHFRKFKILF